MAKVEDVKLDFQFNQPDFNEGFEDDECQVTVTAVLVFEQKDQGKMFFYDVWLRGEDKSGAGEMMFNFTFDGFDKRRIMAPMSKFLPVVKRRIIAADIAPLTALNEDPGVDPPPDDAELPLPLPHGDEIFARVQLYRVGNFGILSTVAHNRSVTHKRWGVPNQD